MPTSADKVILTNLGALKTKYGSEVSQITAAIKVLIAADHGRGMNTRQVNLDDTTAMGKLNAPPVRDASDPKQNKDAIDGVFTALRPDYLLILGSVDVVPHQDLINPAFDPDNPDQDCDKTADGDLPYACDAAYSTQVQDFTAPTRVVGRLPDITGGSDPAYLVGLLTTAANYHSLTFTDYAAYFGISAAIWKTSTTLSLQTVFGPATDMQQVPPGGPPWNAALLGRRAHFINCHGAQGDWKFYGQPEDGSQNYPVAFDATQLPGQLTEGTILAAECCYGAELYNPVDPGSNMGICNTYLQNRAYGYFGSSTIAYGPDDHNDNADLLCQYFWNHVLTGSSLGRATLQARHDYLQSHIGKMGPIDLKTLAQYSLMGDPALQPVQTPADHVVAKSRTADPGAGRGFRRSAFARVGQALGSAVVTAATYVGAPSKSVRDKLRSFLPGTGYGNASFRTFTADIPKLGGSTRKKSRAKRGKKTASAAQEGTVQAVHLAMAVRRNTEIRTPQLAVVVAIEQDGQLIIKKAFSR